jgi:hypothetical protein
MKQMTAGLALAFALVVVGCGGAQTKATSKASCDAAAANAEKVITALGEQQGEDMSAMAAAGRATYSERCAADGWSSEVVACAAGAVDSEAIQLCVEKLTPAQHQAMVETFGAKMKAGQ